MAQTVRISTGFSEKVSENYNSQQYSINLEMDASINGTTTEIEQASDRLFQLCRKIVAHQRVVSGENLLIEQLPQQQYEPPQNLSRNTHAGVQCSEKQVKCIFGVAKSRGMVNGAIHGLARRFGKNNLEELTTQEASALIKELKA